MAYNSVYLTELPIGTGRGSCQSTSSQEVAPIALSAANVMPISADDLDSWERRLEQAVVDDPSIPETDRLAIIRARRGQGAIQVRVGARSSRCAASAGVERILCISSPAVANHGADSTNEERLNGENGLLPDPRASIASSIAGSFGFEDNGRLIISPVAHRSSLERMGIDLTTAVNVGGFNERLRKQFLDFHRNAVLLQSVRR